MKKIIFLDIDGVLNSELWFTSEKYKKLPQSTLFEYKVSDFDPKSVEFLNHLVAETNATIVISSSWRKSTSMDLMLSLLKHVGFKGIVDGYTPTLYTNGKYGSIPRGCEIEAYLQKYYKDKDRGSYQYIILDDDSDMLLHQQENYFRVDAYCGLTPNVVYRAIRFLNKY